MTPIKVPDREAEGTSQRQRKEEDERENAQGRISHKTEAIMIVKKRRQFHCKDCQVVWSKKVCQDTPNSQCRGCNNYYEAVPEGDEVGIGLFICPCGHQFTSKARYSTDCECYACDNKVRPDEIKPFYQMKTKSKKKHACSDCQFGKKNPCPNTNLRPPFSKLLRKGGDEDKLGIKDISKRMSKLQIDQQ